MDEFQKRYEEHQERKKKQLQDETGRFGKLNRKRTKEEFETFLSILYKRRSIRRFNDKEITPLEMKFIDLAVVKTPSSCNRQAVYIKEVDPEIIERYLVGGKGWINNADKVILIFADKDAYKSPNEKAFMPYLDGGHVGQSIYLMCEAIGIGACFVNPNIREENKEDFNNIFNPNGDYFCGSFALGHYDKKPPEPQKRQTAKR